MKTFWHGAGLARARAGRSRSRRRRTRRRAPRRRRTPRARAGRPRRSAGASPRRRGRSGGATIWTLPSSTLIRRTAADSSPTDGVLEDRSGARRAALAAARGRPRSAIRRQDGSWREHRAQVGHGLQPIARRDVVRRPGRGRRPGATATGRVDEADREVDVRAEVHRVAVRCKGRLATRVLQSQAGFPSCSRRSATPRAWPSWMSLTHSQPGFADGPIRGSSGAWPSRRACTYARSSRSVRVPDQPLPTDP